MRKTIARDIPESVANLFLCVICILPQRLLNTARQFSRFLRAFSFFFDLLQAPTRNDLSQKKWGNALSRLAFLVQRRVPQLKLSSEAIALYPCIAAAVTPIAVQRDTQQCGRRRKAHFLKNRICLPRTLWTARPVSQQNCPCLSVFYSKQQEVSGTLAGRPLFVCWVSQGHTSGDLGTFLRFMRPFPS